MRRPRDKYAYQELVWGPEGQRRVRAGRVALFGLGGTGAAHAHLLARAGVGFLRLIDRDVVDFLDLHRTALFDERDAAAPATKAAAAARRLGEINADVQTQAVVAFVNPTNVEELAADVDVLVDGADNFRLRFLLNDVAVRAGRPLVYQGAEAGRGATLAVVPGVGPCLRCLLPETPPLDDAGSCARVGVSPAVVAATAAVGADLTLALLRGEAEAVAGRLCRLGERGAVATVRVERRPDCPVCGRGEFAALEEAPAPYVMACCGGRAYEIFPGGEAALDVAAFADRRGAKRVGEVVVVEEGEGSIVFFGDGRALVYGAGDEAEARALYDRVRGEA
ncbi:MAG: ThiF family adenylyltransferase [Candidatus Coatesbacteria bacterium]|nr:MAG: ThiF family adenylyltransferase [Candidatus Coatesbacteria bacterium]